jgi:hypothetical protein
MQRKERRSLEERIAGAAGESLRLRRHVAPVDVLLDLGWLAPSHLLEWQTRRLPFLTSAIQTDPARVSQALRMIESWAESHGLLRRPRAARAAALRRRAADAPRASRQWALGRRPALESDAQAIRKDRHARRTRSAGRCAAERREARGRMSRSGDLRLGASRIPMESDRDGRRNPRVA